MKFTRSERDVIERAWECIKQHPELGRIYKKDLIPLESNSTNGLIRTAVVRDKYSNRVIFCGETEETYFEAKVVKRFF